MQNQNVLRTQLLLAGGGGVQMYLIIQSHFDARIVYRLPRKE